MALPPEENDTLNRLITELYENYGSNHILLVMRQRHPGTLASWSNVGNIARRKGLKVNEEGLKRMAAARTKKMNATRRENKADPGRSAKEELEALPMEIERVRQATPPMGEVLAEIREFGLKRFSNKREYNYVR